MVPIWSFVILAAVCVLTAILAALMYRARHRLALLGVMACGYLCITSASWFVEGMFDNTCHDGGPEIVCWRYDKHNP